MDEEYKTNELAREIFTRLVGHHHNAQGLVEDSFKRMAVTSFQAADAFFTVQRRFEEAEGDPDLTTI
jgi:hypothetical protein